MFDFTLHTYRQFLEKHTGEGYAFQTLADFLNNPLEKIVIARHDIDARRQNALDVARIHHTLGIRGTSFVQLLRYLIGILSYRFMDWGMR
jgi:hypothetical protein